ncbi:hypothetical protein Purlil1_13353 [Purpureocillium lilacinum]|uniref:Uncharacterized protein n=1 Tax=Purpureocillium lilacinum TaxID=33203 RepID=A0ABR0BEY8_PURLI|nr:hypothetical protein Purlil1_13353 [Purpureocillium lilacinum]
MKLSTVAFFTLLSGSLAAPQAGAASESDKPDIAARDFQTSGPHAVDTRRADALAAEGFDVEEEDGVRVRAAEKKANGKKKAKGKKRVKGKKKAKGKKKNAKAAKASATSTAAARVTNSNDAPGVV